ncbi:MAG TPA: MaoC family dehydratase N-terminal domain-containing protein [Burkholderiales bacterium]|nr:MaoC family dehydratase N-terminal domain-containing protein [Burkholderiales bacterium]
MSDDLEQLRGWVGKTEIRNDVATAWPVRALAATMDSGAIDTAEGQPIPTGWHWLYFLEAKPPAEVGPDGHPRKGGFLPPVPLPRRMWAGGRLEYLAPIAIGAALRRESEILSVEPKSGRSGTLVFVTVRHTVYSGAAKAIVEEQDIVYREAAKKGDPMPPGKAAPANAPWTRSVTPDPVMLFRFSALTFNGHRIHYDRDYAINEEHYPGLVIHGPLQAMLLLELCRRHGRSPVKKLEYRAQYPIFLGADFSVNGSFDKASSQADVWTASDAGYYAMRGTATF